MGGSNRGSSALKGALDRATSEFESQLAQMRTQYNLQQQAKEYNSQQLANALEARGATNFSLGNYSQAISDFTQAINLDRLNVKAYAGRALAYFKLGNINAARSDFVIAAKLGSPEAQAIAKSWGLNW